MARCPFATWEPLGTPGGPISPRTVIVHSEATKGLAKPRAGAPLEWHFMVRRDGRILQHVDTQRRADANNKANAFAVSIETEDDGDPDREPWTDAQLWALERLIRWVCTAHRIPLRRCPSWQTGGVGFHTMFGAPSPWTPVVKTCPGRVRIAQFNDVLLPALVGAPLTEETPHLFASIVAALKTLFRYPSNDDTWTPQQRRDAEWWYQDVAVPHGEKAAIALLALEARKAGKLPAAA